jgi:23S rRNA pseudouridine2457 synthase
MLIAFNKPHGVISQFTREHPSHRVLADFGFPKDVYPIGRLDLDSEGLLLLSDEGHWNEQLLQPRHGHERTYHAQVEGLATEASLEKLRRGVRLPDFTTRPCHARLLEPSPQYSPRVPPVRERKTVPTSWIELILTEGKNRQVRRMTAAVGLPTLRLIRVAIGALTLEGVALPPAEWKVLSAEQSQKVFTRLEG